MKIRNPNALRSTDESDWIKHLCYEIEMFRTCFLILKNGTNNQFERNMHIECFILHARNLLEFFKNKNHSDVDPRRFTNTSYNPDGNFINNSLERKMNQQISHLTSDRIKNNENQLIAKNFHEISISIEDEIKRFEACLKPQFQAIWSDSLRLMNFSHSIIAVSNKGHSATNNITLLK